MDRVTRFELSRTFVKRLRALPPQRQRRVEQALRAAMEDLRAPSLGLHELKGPLAGTYSINAGGDLRIHFEPLDAGPGTVALLTTVGTHSQLYG
jgi:mRNA-degrading endonuclease YafQ of YafQ-DinJ toxin-antitoxin module